MNHSISRVVLASTSPFRAKIMESFGIPFRAVAPAVDEESITAATPELLAMARAEAKALACLPVPSPQPDDRGAPNSGCLVIGADQVLGLDGQPWGKAADAQEAARRLQLFAGRRHTLHSALALAWHTGDGCTRLLESGVENVDMSMRALSPAEIDAYVATGEWQGCAGCYRLEGHGVLLFDGISGESSAVIGLPRILLSRLLRGVGVDLLLNPAGPWTLRD